LLLDFFLLAAVDLGNPDVDGTGFRFYLRVC
jgi:hypothetical protein